MKSVLALFCLAFVISLTTSSCTSHRVYDTGQAWQRKECNKIIDQSERERCMSEANTPYEDYKHEIEGGRK